MTSVDRAAARARAKRIADALALRMAELGWSSVKVEEDVVEGNWVASAFVRGGAEHFREVGSTPDNAVYNLYVAALEVAEADL